MAVNINTVYTTVLYILNKEQRGYITPAEFNSLATQVQEEIFESYFPDGNQLNRPNQQNIQNDTDFFNMFKNNAYKLYPFEEEASFTYNAANDGWIYGGSRPLYNIGEVISTYNTTSPQSNGPRYDSITQVGSRSDYNEITRSKLTKPTAQYPLAYITNVAIAPSTIRQVFMKIFPKPDSVIANCIVNPTNPNWAFTIGSLGQYLYNNTASIDFQLDISEQTNIITNILKYAGVIIRDQEIIQTAMQDAAKVEQNEKS